MDAAALGFVRIACAVPELHLGDPAANARATAASLAAAAAAGAQVVLCPELGLTGYTCGDLFHQEALLAAARLALRQVAAEAGRLELVAVVGLPLRIGDRLFNCAAVLAGGRVAGLVPKTLLPIHREFYERRWFSPAEALGTAQAELDGEPVPVGGDLVFPLAGIPGAVLGVELCEDLWGVAPPSATLALGGATILLNPSASDELIGKAAYRRELVRGQAARCLAAYAYAGAGPGESSTDLVFGGHALIAENGALLAEGERFRFSAQLVCADIDVQQLGHERLRSAAFAAAGPPPLRPVAVPCRPWHPGAGLLRPLPARPFVPDDAGARDAVCAEIAAIQATALARRLRHAGARRAVIGLSGGLDSTLALLVAVEAIARAGLPAAALLAVTMPGFGTTARTRGNAHRLAELLGIELREIPIGPAVERHFRDIGHDPARRDHTYENCQARERTQILMDLANQVDGLCLGTGDLSEAALGWCTFNGDHMSMYQLNAGVPKTLVRSLVEWHAARQPAAVAAVLADICATPISPELLPPAADGAIAQETEAVVGPYELHDFVLFHLLRHGSAPAKIAWLAERAFAGRFERAVILHWMRVLYRRFFAQQFKRSAMPDGPKVGSVALSPRGDWRMPSDALATAWLAQLDRLHPPQDTP